MLTQDPERRRTLPLLAGAPLVATVMSAARPSYPTRRIDHTYLKATSGLRRDLISYIERNWFSMDRAALELGLFTSYAWYENVDLNAEWDVLVVVGYASAQGFDDPAVQAAFAKIKAEHKEVPVAGKTLRDLGTIVRSDRLRPSPAAARSSS